ncbi:MAG: hypothetical protein M3305_16705, partial [Actinomycetota bacterium]|nr:hypothetical protein [Actinomycetota bacterium]
RAATTVTFRNDPYPSKISRRGQRRSANRAYAIALATFAAIQRERYLTRQYLYGFYFGYYLSCRF